MSKIGHHFGPRMVEVYQRVEDNAIGGKYVWLGYAQTKPAHAVWSDEMKAWVVEKQEENE